MNHKLSEAMDHIHDAYIMDAVGTYSVPVPRKNLWIGAMAAALFLVLMSAIMIPIFNGSDISGSPNPVQPSTTITSTTAPTDDTTVPTSGSTTVPTTASTTQPTTASTTLSTTMKPTAQSTQPTTKDPCADGHTYQNGYCIYCTDPDPDYNDPCANGHYFLDGFCINCGIPDPLSDPCANGHTYDGGRYCIYCSYANPNYDPCANGHTYNGGKYCVYCLHHNPNYDPCANGHSYTGGVCIYCGSPMPGYGDLSALEDEYGATLKIIIPGYNAMDTSLWQTRAISSFKATYPNVTVQIITADWVSWYDKLMAAYLSGDPIDLIYDGVNNQPKLSLMGITQPLQNYINMDNPNLKLFAMDECFKYGGNYYVAASEVNYGVIYYNKDMFTAAGLEDPLSLYRKGQWNWTTFTQYANALTNKSEGKWGFSTEFPFLFYGANATSTLKLDANGNYSLNMDDPAFIAALEIIQDGWYDSGWSGYESSAMSSFQLGNTAMLGSFTMYESDINHLAGMYGWVDINYGVVPMPYGPHNPTGKNMIHSAGWAIGAGSDCPVHVGKLIDMLVDAYAVYATEQNAKLPASSLVLYAEMGNNVFCVNTRDSGISGGYELANDVAKGMAISQAIAEYKPQYQSLIDQYRS